MRIIRRSHQHIKAETLSEYLDGRIQGSALARVGQQLAACQLCREEMESLRSAITMLRELPEEAPRRSFVMAAPPPMPARAPSSAFQLRDFLRVPQWAYAGAASVAVIVLVALISADATGLLSPDGAPEFQFQSTAITQEIESQATGPSPQTKATGIEDQELERAFPSATSEAGDGDSQAAATAAPEAAQALTEDTAPQAASAPVALAAEAAPSVAAAAAPAEEPSPEETAEALGPRGAPGAASADAAAERQTPMPAPPKVDMIPATTPTSTRVPQSQNEGTAVVWRVLEGVAAFFGLIFLLALVFKWRLSDKSG